MAGFLCGTYSAYFCSRSANLNARSTNFFSHSSDRSFYRNSDAAHFFSRSVKIFRFRSIYRRFLAVYVRFARAARGRAFEAICFLCRSGICRFLNCSSSACDSRSGSIFRILAVRIACTVEASRAVDFAGRHRRLAIFRAKDLCTNFRISVTRYRTFSLFPTSTISGTSTFICICEVFCPITADISMSFLFGIVCQFKIAFKLGFFPSFYHLLYLFNPEFL